MKKLNIKTLITAFTALILTVSQTTFACTSFNYVAPDGSRIVGHSMELPVEAHEHLALIPRGHQFAEDGIKALYGFVAMQHGTGDATTISSGMNEHGVSITAQELGMSVYASQGKGDLSHWNVPAYILGNAKSVDHAVELLSKLSIYQGNDVFGTMGTHWSIQDNDRAIVVEVESAMGIPTVYESVGAMANSPSYDTQIVIAKEKFNNAQDLRKVDRNQVESVGVYGNQTSPDRFQRAIFLNATADFSRDDSKAAILNHTWNMLNTFDIAQGTLYWTWLAPEPQTVTHFTVHDLKEKAYYYRTYKDMNIKKVDVNAIDWATAKYSSSDIYKSVTKYENVTF
ncbi:linear amide C-N hydrolase [Flammeovirga aprica]|uniref:Linear amide C-N hydrolase n=1 Tax=Flammeovirga aprica JL-4 TaxID=694437 RepID=A0A7X9P0P7_9BACT|nr:linear amide C-N hydrolase [Flammeovirga aprica]NME66862.1 linear amide C-N hydrolase [Flammeovirga aprica JL-4]